jgi:hypothetical protein
MDNLLAEVEGVVLTGARRRMANLGPGLPDMALTRGRQATFLTAYGELNSWLEAGDE